MPTKVYSAIPNEKYTRFCTGQIQLKGCQIENSDNVPRIVPLSLLDRVFHSFSLTQLLVKLVPED